jgi:hypothetical protein
MDIQVQTKGKTIKTTAGRPAKEDNSTKGWVLVLSFTVYSRFQNV